jgi:hypothetical protein
VLRVYGIRIWPPWLAPDATFRSGRVSCRKRFRDDYGLRVGSDLGTAMILSHGFRRSYLAKRAAENGVNTEQRRLLAGTAERIFVSKGGVLCVRALLHTIRAVIAK